MRTSDQHQPELDTFDARAYLLAMPPEEREQAADDFDPREYLLAGGEPETDCARIEHAMAQVGFQDPQVTAIGDGGFAFRVRVDGNPENYDPATLHAPLVLALEAAGSPAWLIHIGNQLGADMLVEGDFNVG
jgi:hypothetical protein